MLATLAALVVVLAALFGAISRPSGSASPAMIPQPPSVAMGAVLTASIAVADNEQLRLMSYDLSAAQLAPGAILTITLYWQTQRNLVGDYTVFIHLLDATGRLMASHDAPPAEGTRPTRGWRIGEPITDSHTLVLPNSSHSGRLPAVRGPVRSWQRRAPGRWRVTRSVNHYRSLNRENL